MAAFRRTKSTCWSPPPSSRSGRRPQRRADGDRARRAHGLAQLHQLRGGSPRQRESVCVLLYEKPLSELARARLKVIFELTDGFEIARQDLLCAAPANSSAAARAACPCCLADLERDVALLEQARDYAQRSLKSHPKSPPRTSSAGGCPHRAVTDLIDATGSTRNVVNSASHTSISARKAAPRGTR